MSGTYMHGAGAAEQERLEAQAELLGGARFLPPLRAGMKVVELGCGTGAIAREVAWAVAPGEVLGIDAQSEQVEAATRRAAALGLGNVRFRRGDAGALDLADGSFDAAYCRFLLEHLADPVRTLREMTRAVGAGGWVCAYEWQNGSHTTFPDNPAVKEVWRGIYRLQERTGGDANVAMKLPALLRAAGLRDVTLRADAFAFCAGDGDRLAQYCSGAREIVRQARDGLLAERLADEALLARADAEYDELLASPDGLVIEVMCCATGVRP